MYTYEKQNIFWKHVQNKLTNHLNYYVIFLRKIIYLSSKTKSQN